MRHLCFLCPLYYICWSVFLAASFYHQYLGFQTIRILLSHPFFSAFFCSNSIALKAYVKTFDYPVPRGGSGRNLKVFCNYKKRIGLIVFSQLLRFFALAIISVLLNRPTFFKLGRVYERQGPHPKKNGINQYRRSSHCYWLSDILSNKEDKGPFVVNPKADISDELGIFFKQFAFGWKDDFDLP